MVAYNFQRRFAPQILDGTKTQTVRADRKRHARPGEALQLFTGMRTKNCAKIVDDPVCTTVHPIRIVIGVREFRAITIGELPTMPHSMFDIFARLDGFENADDMHAFWSKAHPVSDVFRGVLIRWKAPAPSTIIGCDMARSSDWGGEHGTSL